MPLPDDPQKLERHLAAAGGLRATPSIPPMLPGEWRPGMPCHWTEITPATKWRYRLIRILILLHAASGIAYLQYRARQTIGIYTTQPVLVAYQIFFFVLEIISIVSIVFRIFEDWSSLKRNCIDFKNIPTDLIAPHFSHSRRAKTRPEHANYPSIGVFIPCYNEDVDLVLETVLGALNIDYPRELVTVYLCDDGKDQLKRSMISQLRKQYKNIHYVVRPDNSHAKAGNLNYSLERTTSDLVVTLDADFVARPNLLQRLIPYYYVWNPTIGMYEFNETVAVVQTPQYFRNLSAYDSDPLDQRGTLFFSVVQPGKDYFNASTMIGTTNLLSRAALQEAGYYPYHSITEDTAMSLAFHSLGYRTYWVSESLATGLATTSLWSNLSQRARWLKGDWQILFSRKGPVTVKGLSFVQRLLYLHMTYARLSSVVHLLYDLGAVLLLVAAISPLDAPDPKLFIIYISIVVLMSFAVRFAITTGNPGVGKSESGSVVFEAIFRYTTVKGMVLALFGGQNLKFKVTDKSGVPSKDKKKKTGVPETEEEPVEKFDENARHTVLGRGSPEQEAVGMESSGGVSSSNASPDVSDRQSTTSTGQGDDSSSTATEDDDGRSYKKMRRPRTPEERATRRKDIVKNLKRIWFNIFMAILLMFSVVYACVNPPNPRTEPFIFEGELVRLESANVLPLAMALGFAVMNLLPHLLAIYLCFIPYVSGWVMTDLVHGRCDQFAVHPKTGKLFVPWSFISLVAFAKALILFGSIGALAYFAWGTENSGLQLVPVNG